MSFEMDTDSFRDMVQERRSVRGYREDRVPRDVIEEIIEIAGGAPSSMNTQPWHFHVLTGEPLDLIREGNTERMVNGAAPQREISLNHGYEGVHRDRQIEIAVQLFESMGIAWEDKERRTDWAMRGFRQFDAPVSIVVTCDKTLEHDTVGHFGCVINGQGIMQSDVVREHANIPEDQVIMTCVAMGYPDDSFVANDVKSTRRSVNEVASFVGFDD